MVEQEEVAHEAGECAAEKGKGAPAGPTENLATFSALYLGRKLRPYQEEIADAVVESIRQQRGETFTVMMARQMGKNELSAHLEAWLLFRYAEVGGTIVKAAPTFRPQALQSLLRLEACLRRPALQPLLARYGKWRREQGYMIALGEARVAFYSAEPQANVVGATASLLLEVDEAQHVDAEKYGRDFRPMASSTNATTVLYGTAWRADSLLEEEKRRSVDREALDGKRRHFAFNWEAADEVNPAYGRFVRGEIDRLGHSHPMIKTQYLLECLDGEDGFFNQEQRLLLRGTHPREREPMEGVTYVAGIDVAGGAEEAPEAALTAAGRRKDSTVAGIARVTRSEDGSQPLTQLVEIYWWTGQPLHEQCERLLHLLKAVWHCRRVVVDATGLGLDLATRLQLGLGRAIVEPFVFSAQSKDRLAYQVLSHVKAGRLQMWAEPDGRADGSEAHSAASPEAVEFWKEVALVRPVVRSGGKLGFSVPAAQGHDDFVSMLALVSWATRSLSPAPAHAILVPPPLFEDEGKYW